MAESDLFRLPELVAEAAAVASKGVTARVNTVLNPALPSVVRGDFAGFKRLLVSLFVLAIEPGADATCEVSAANDTHAGLNWIRLDVCTGDASPRPGFASIQRQVDALGGYFERSHSAAPEHVFSATVVIPLLAPGQEGDLSWQLAELAAQVRDPGRTRAAASGVRPETLRRARILMAEDNAINQKVGMLILRRAGFEIDVVVDGAAAVAAHRDAVYQVILMDCQMPVMDGFEATRQIRRLDGPQPAIIAVTANALAGEKERCLEAGMDDYLPKPFRAEKLVERVRFWVAQQSLEGRRRVGRDR